MDKVTWIVTILSLIGVWLNIKKKKICFKIWAVTNFFWATYNYYVAYHTNEKGLYAQAALFTIYFLLALYGIYEWRKTNMEENQ